MPVLSQLKRLLLVVTAVVGLSGCDRGSSAYRHIKELPYSEWNHYAASLPVEERLDLHKEIMERSGHNAKMTIEESFAGQPAETYKSIVSRIKSGDKSRYYVGVIYGIDGSHGFKICSQPDRSVIISYLSGMTWYPEHERYQPNFSHC